MKRKLDFVTNSSSCSFVFIGWVIDASDKTIEIVKENMDIFGTNEYDPKLRPYENLNEVYNGKVSITLGDGDNGLIEGNLCIGLTIHIREDDFEPHIYTIQDLLNIDDKLTECFDPKDIKIISGMDGC
jgi:hypothetical protein